MAPAGLLTFLQSTGAIPPGLAAEIAADFVPHPIRKNELLLQAGRVSDEYLFLENGLLRAFTHDAEDREVTTGFYSGGQVALEVASFFQRTPSQESMQALTAGIGWTLTYQQLNGLFHARPEFREFGRAVLVRALAALKTRLLDQVRLTATERYKKLVSDHPEILQQAPVKYVASYLGVTDSSLSRIRAGVRGEVAA